ncbi:diaminopimelate epimerase [Aquibacillus koreensis]|uniref:Diaminopimelate epimerase n=1 Tax=Aquibacillus koreensis TaxID=279446 RepID=A0A9X3WN73_9BACI|nr:diaminopimelate epimerase [Aquibacillus koreensis]MCT2535878.1 diaminopimelate epimerase [Aquibacillus koreensis]MDC3420334.1 diaminopimelate epimerase [Aquibacillus koreensis]
MNIPFTKMHGLGNSYIFLDLFKYQIEEELLAPLAIDIANKDIGIGSDGLILIHPSIQADVGMRIFNKDGSEGKNCGNGLRCVAKYAYENNLVESKTFSIETKAGNVTAEIRGDRAFVEEVTVDMGEPILKRNLIPMEGNADEQVIAESFEISHHPLVVTAVSMGNPHAIFFVEDIAEAPLTELGPIITVDQRFPEGVNVEFVEIVSDKEMHFRVWERGSGITQGCGTGACAAVVASILNGFANKGEEICVHLSGGDLFITWANDGHVWMRGNASTTVSGEFYWNPKS